MSLGDDYLELIDLMWEIDEFDMWEPLNHLNLAYVMDKLSETDEYDSYVNLWKNMAVEKDFNNLAWSIKKKTYSFVFGDKRFSEKNKENWQKLYKLNEKIFREKRALDIITLSLGMGKYAPKWFMPLFNSYMPLKEAMRDQAIKQYCREIRGMTVQETEEAFVKISRWYDILNECYFYVKNRRFKPRKMVHIQLEIDNELIDKVVTAEEICATTGMDPVEAYIWMYSARDDRTAATRKLLDMQK